MFQMETHSDGPSEQEAGGGSFWQSTFLFLCFSHCLYEIHWSKNFPSAFLPLLLSTFLYCLYLIPIPPSLFPLLLPFLSFHSLSLLSQFLLFFPLFFYSLIHSLLLYFLLFSLCIVLVYDWLSMKYWPNLLFENAIVKNTDWNL